MGILKTIFQYANWWQAIYKPWEVREKRNRVRARPIKKTADEVIYESVERESELYEDMERHKVLGHNQNIMPPWF